MARFFAHLTAARSSEKLLFVRRKQLQLLAQVERGRETDRPVESAFDLLARRAESGERSLPKWSSVGQLALYNVKGSIFLFLYSSPSVPLASGLLFILAAIASARSFGPQSVRVIFF